MFLSAARYSNPYALALLVASLTLATRLIRRQPRRLSVIPREQERVLVLGASSGIGHSIACEYAKQGAKVCLVGRRLDKITEAVASCLNMQHDHCPEWIEDRGRILGVKGDFADVESMISVRNTLEVEWGGLDTLVVAAGVSALRPLLDIAKDGIEPIDASCPSSEGVHRVLSVSKAAIAGNYYGPLVSAVTFIPILERTSVSPSILLISSLGSVVPAPTRTLYGSTKAASFILFKALSIEHPKVAFSCMLPSTVEGDFRASAVDAGPIRETNISTSALKRDAVALRSIRAVDHGEKTVFMPGYMKMGMALYWLWPSFVEEKARRKYGFVT